MLLRSFNATCVWVLGGLYTTFILNLSENGVGLDVRAVGRVEDYRESSGLNIWKFGLSA
jgi:hypothetical protein